MPITHLPRLSPYPKFGKAGLIGVRVQYSKGLSLAQPTRLPRFRSEGEYPLVRIAPPQPWDKVSGEAELAAVADGALIVGADPHHDKLTLHAVEAQAEHLVDDPPRLPRAEARRRDLNNALARVPVVHDDGRNGRLVLQHRDGAEALQMPRLAPDGHAGELARAAVDLGQVRFGGEYGLEHGAR